MSAAEAAVARAVRRMDESTLRRAVAIASGELAQRMGGGAAAEVLNRITSRLPGAPRADR